LVFYKKDYILKNWQYFSNKVNDPFPYEVMWDEKNLIDVDTEVDFELVRSFYEKK